MAKASNGISSSMRHYNRAAGDQIQKQANSKSYKPGRKLTAAVSQSNNYAFRRNSQQQNQQNQQKTTMTNQHTRVNSQAS